MHANNEVGTVHPVEAMGKICKEAGVVFHVDAAQSAGRLIIDVRAASIDLLSLSGHKMYGPKGIGALFVRSGDPALRIEPQIHGGGQEKGLRSGTLAVALIVGFGKAAELALKLREQDSIHALELREALLEILKASCQNIVINGHPIRRLPGNLHVTLTGVDAEILLLKAGAVACSTTSACSTGSSAPSHVLKAIGLGDQAILSSLRLGVGRFTTAEEIQQAGRLLAAAFQQSAKAMA
jgi:cysteine desulfurase